MIVLDAAALIDVVVDQPAKDWVLDGLRDEDVLAPAHQPAEVLSAISRLHRAGELSAHEAEQALDEATALPQELVVPSPEHIRRAFQLGDRLRVLDGLYVALAEERGVALLTTDLRISQADPPCRVLAPS